MSNFNLHTELLKQGCEYKETAENRIYDYKGSMLIVHGDKNFIYKLPDIERSLLFSAPINTETTKELLELLTFINENLYIYRNMFGDYQINCRGYNE